MDKKRIINSLSGIFVIGIIAFIIVNLVSFNPLKKGDIVYVRDEANKYDYRIEQSDFDYEPPDDDDDWGP